MGSHVIHTPCSILSENIEHQNKIVFVLEKSGNLVQICLFTVLLTKQRQLREISELEFIKALHVYTIKWTLSNI